MALILAQVTFERQSGVPEDRVINTWHFSTPGALPLPADLDRITTMLQRFYTLNLAAPQFSVSTFLSNFLTSPFTVTMYNLDLPAPRQPIRQDQVVWVPVVSGSNFPAEVAGVLSYRTDPVPGVSLASTRGRIYLGPLRAASGLDLISDNRPSITWQQVVSGAAARLVDDGATPGAAWVIYSPTRRAAGAGTYFWAVTNGFVDDAWDTQRRRGRGASGRMIW